MPKKADVKAVAVVTVGVMVAGFLMYQFRDIGLIRAARSGYDM